MYVCMYALGNKVQGPEKQIFKMNKILFFCIQQLLNY